MTVYAFPALLGQWLVFCQKGACGLILNGNSILESVSFQMRIDQFMEELLFQKESSLTL